MEPFANSSNGIGCGKPARQNITPIFLKALIAAWHDIGSLFHINTRKHLFRFQVVNVTPALLTLAEHHWYHHCQHLFNFQEEIKGLDFLFFLVSTQQPITELEANIHKVFWVCVDIVLKNQLQPAPRGKLFVLTESLLCQTRPNREIRRWSSRNIER